VLRIRPEKEDIEHLLEFHKQFRLQQQKVNITYTNVSNEVLFRAFHHREAPYALLLHQFKSF
jgi:hypothetical protein